MAQSSRRASRSCRDPGNDGAGHRKVSAPLRRPDVPFQPLGRLALGPLTRSLEFEPHPFPLLEPGQNQPQLTHDLGLVTDVWAHWDSAHFLEISAGPGYHGDPSLAAFYPLYPGLVGLFGRLFLGH